MKKVEEVVSVTYTCDTCQKTTTDNTNWYNLDYINANWIRLFEKKLARARYETKHLVDRKEINFCCKDCIKEYLVKSVESLISEMSNPLEESREFSL
jgi:hypothetical protein